MNKMIMVYTTVDSLIDAERLARKAVSEKVAVCVNIIPQGRSIYIWNNAVDQNNECYLWFKTTVDLQDTLIQWIDKNHPYDTPAIIKIEAETVDSFFAYMNQALGPTP